MSSFTLLKSTNGLTHNIRVDFALEVNDDDGGAFEAGRDFAQLQ